MCIFTHTSISPGPLLRQLTSRYAIRAGRNLPDKEFRYLRTVIVTAAVYWTGYDFAQYALGKFLQGQNRTNEAVSWSGKAAAQENTCAAYRLGKLYLEGKDVPKDVQKAIGSPR